MSVIGLQSGLYKQLHDYAELVDDSLLCLKSGLPPSKDESCQKLARLLIGMSSDNWDETPLHIFLFSFSNFKESERQEWASTGKALLSDVAGSTDIRQLDRLADLLEQKQSSVMARIRES
jgi:hypothetical protein